MQQKYILKEFNIFRFFQRQKSQEDTGERGSHVHNNFGFLSFSPSFFYHSFLLVACHTIQGKTVVWPRHFIVWGTKIVNYFAMNVTSQRHRPQHWVLPLSKKQEELYEVHFSSHKLFFCPQRLPAWLQNRGSSKNLPKSTT